AVLRQLAPELATIHAQNETVLAFNASARLKLLDIFAGNLLDKVAERYGEWRALRTKIDELSRSEQDRLRLVDLWSFQLREIDSARLEAGEDQRLEGERRVLMNSEKLYASAMGAYEALYESQNSVLTGVRTAGRQLEELAKYEPRFAESLKLLDSARADLEDISASARDYAAQIDASPERLAEVDDRLATIDRLKRKYGSNVEEIIAFAEDLRQKLNEVENRDEVLRSLRRELESAAQAYLNEARALSRLRVAAARKLEKLAESEINELAMKAAFHVEVKTSEDESEWSSSGLDSVTYLIGTNAGEPLNPIENIASGGELSRVMLALKASVETGQGRTNGNGKSRRQALQRTLVFDEIDTGIGGRAAEAVGKKLKTLGTHNQVLCVTHLPQIASFADHHLLIEKHEVAGRTKTDIRPLDVKERKEEIARMLSGARLTETSLKHAEQMIRANA